MLDLDSVKAWIKKTDTDRDDVLQDLIDRALEAVERQLDWYFGDPREAEEILNGNGRPVMFLRQFPVDADVTVYCRDYIGATWVEVDATLYEVDSRKVAVQGVFIPGVRNYRFVYQEGFATIPGDIEQLVLDLVKRKWFEGKIGITSETLGRYSYSLGDLETASGWTSVMNNWRRGLA
jgi:hypothetical protein